MFNIGKLSKAIKSEQDGFTLVELMVVVVIIGVLVAIAVPIYNTVTDNAEQNACESNQRIVDGAWQTYRASDDYDSNINVNNWDTLMDELVPDFIQEEPECPGEGTYTWTDTGGTQCDVH